MEFGLDTVMQLLPGGVYRCDNVADAERLTTGRQRDSAYYV